MTVLSDVAVHTFFGVWKSGYLSWTLMPNMIDSLQTNSGDFLEMCLGDWRAPLAQEREASCLGPILRGVLQLLDEWLKVAFIVKIVGIDGGVTGKISCASNIAALWYRGVELRVIGCKVRGNSGQMVERIEGIRVGVCQGDRAQRHQERRKSIHVGIYNHRRASPPRLSPNLLDEHES